MQWRQVVEKDDRSDGLLPLWVIFQDTLHAWSYARGLVHE
jgi:hypothetical protein